MSLMISLDDDDDGRLLLQQRVAVRTNHWQ